MAMSSAETKRERIAARLASTSGVPVACRGDALRLASLSEASVKAPPARSAKANPKTKSSPKMKPPSELLAQSVIDIGVGRDALHELPKTKRPDMLGNSLWRLRRAHRGYPRRFETPESLLAAAEEYFEWMDANPLIKHKVTQFRGKPVPMTVRKMRAMTLTGLCLHLGMTRGAWVGYRTREGFEAAVEYVESVIYTQKFEGVAANLLNPSIIARELGLKADSDITSGDQPVTEIVRTIIDDKAANLNT